MKKPISRIFARQIKQIKYHTKYDNYFIIDVEIDELIDEVDTVLMLLENHPNFRRPEVKKMILETLEKNDGN